MLIPYSSFSLLVVSIACLNTVGSVPVHKREAEPTIFKGGEFPWTELVGDVPTNTINNSVAQSAPPSKTSVLVSPTPVRTIGVFSRGNPDRSIFLSVVEEKTTSFASISTTSLEATPTASVTATPTTNSIEIAENSSQVSSKFQEEPTTTHGDFNTASTEPFTTTELVGDVPTNTINNSVDQNAPTETSVAVTPTPVRTVGVFSRAGPDNTVSLSLVEEETSSFAAISTTSSEATPNASATATPISVEIEENSSESTSEFPEEPTATEPNTVTVTPVPSYGAPLEQDTDIPNPTLTSIASTGAVTATITDAPTGVTVLPTAQSQTEEIAEPQGRPTSALFELANALQKMLSMFVNGKTQPRSARKF